MAKRRRRRKKKKAPKEPKIDTWHREEFDTMVIEIQEHLGEGFKPNLLLGRPKDFPQERDFAYTEISPSGTITVVIAPKLLVSEKERFYGVMFHEMGHAVDFFLDADMCHKFGKSLGVYLSQTPERRADMLGGAMFGVVIFYDRDLVQTIEDNGNYYPRPVELGL
jgi:hypothetical protein